MRHSSVRRALFALGLVVMACAGGGDRPSSLREAVVYRNVSAAMSPTLGEGETVAALPFADSTAAAREVRRGDLVVYAWPLDTARKFIKRVAGLPGDTLSMVARRLVVNGETLDEPYAWHSDSAAPTPPAPELEWQRAHLASGVARDYRPTRDDWGPLVVPAGSYFVLGDNRDDSLDSRYWGFVSAGGLLARVTPASATMRRP